MFFSSNINTSKYNFIFIVIINRWQRGLRRHYQHDRLIGSNDWLCKYSHRKQRMKKFSIRLSRQLHDLYIYILYTHSAHTHTLGISVNTIYDMWLIPQSVEKCFSTRAEPNSIINHSNENLHIQEIIISMCLKINRLAPLRRGMLFSLILFCFIECSPSSSSPPPPPHITITHQYFIAKSSSILLKRHFNRFSIVELIEHRINIDGWLCLCGTFCSVRLLLLFIFVFKLYRSTKKNNNKIIEVPPSSCKLTFKWFFKIESCVSTHRAYLPRKQRERERWRENCLKIHFKYMNSQKSSSSSNESQPMGT